MEGFGSPPGLELPGFELAGPWASAFGSPPGLELQGVYAQLQGVYAELQRKDSELQRVYAELQRKDSELQRKDSKLQGVKAELHLVRAQLEELQTINTLAPCAANGRWREGLSSLAHVARSLIEEANMMLVVGALLDEPLDNHNIARAYQAVWPALLCNEEINFDIAKDMLRLVRDLLVLNVTIGRGPWTNTKLQDTMEELFQKPLQDVHPHLDSQIIGAFNQILRFARDRDDFDKTNIILLGEALDTEQINDVFTAYSCSALTSPGYRSRSKFNGKSKPKNIKSPSRSKSPRRSRAEQGHPNTANAADAADAAAADAAAGHPGTANAADAAATTADDERPATKPNA